MKKLERYKPFFEKVVNPQTKTPQFKKWFGKSKVVDKSGNPLVVYHGSSKDFNVFSKNNINEPSGDYVGVGHYFAKKPETARKYGNNIREFYLNIENPIFINSEKDAKEFRDKIGDVFYKEYKNMFTQSVLDLYPKMGGELLYFQLKKKDPSLIQKAVIKMKYDGLIDNLYGQYAVFKANQLKSATNNKGTFNSKSDNITERYKPLFKENNLKPITKLMTIY
jgi:hypothetical protein